jgi:hypothetical protein
MGFGRFAPLRFFKGHADFRPKQTRTIGDGAQVTV